MLNVSIDSKLKCLPLYFKGEDSCLLEFTAMQVSIKDFAVSYLKEPSNIVILDEVLAKCKKIFSFDQSTNNQTNNQEITKRFLELLKSDKQEFLISLISHVLSSYLKSIKFESNQGIHQCCLDYELGDLYSLFHISLQALVTLLSELLKYQEPILREHIQRDINFLGSMMANS